MTYVKSQVNSLQSTVAEISSGLSNVQSSVDALTNYDDSAVVAQLATISQTLADLASSLDGVATNEDLAVISSTLADIETDVHELLEANAVVNQNITINNVATLEYVESLISTGADDPNVIVNGSVTVDITASNFDAAQLVRVNAVTAKLATVLQAVSITNNSSPTVTVDLSNLGFVDNDYTVNGADANDAALRSVTGSVTIGHGGAVDYSQISNVGGNVIINNSATSLNLNGSTITGSIWTSGDAAGTITLPSATTVNVGTAQVTTASLTLATDIDLGNTGALTALTVQAPKTVTVDVAAKSITGNLDLSGVKSDATVNMNSATTLSGTTTVTAGNFSASALTKIASTTITASTVNLSALTSNTSGTLTINTATALNAPNFVVANTVTGAALTDVTIGSATNTLLVAAAAKNITIGAQANTSNFDASGYAALETLSVTVKVNASPTAANVTSVVTATNTTLKSASVAGMLDTVIISGTSALTSFSSAGNIRSVTINNADALETLTFGHDHINGSNAAELHITENAKITTFDLSSIGDVKTLQIVNNALLTSFSAPSSSTITENVATIVATVTGNKLFGTYTQGTAKVTATESTPEIPAVQASIVQASVYDLRLWLEANYSHTTSPTYRIEVDEVDGNADGNHDGASDGDYQTIATADANNTADDNANDINIKAELNTVKKE